MEQLYDQETGHILIIAPKSIAKATWSAEIDKWDIKIPYKSLIVNKNGKPLSRTQRLNAYYDVVKNPVRTIYFINREMVCDLIENSPRRGKAVIWPYQTVVIDELQSFKSPNSKRFLAIRNMMPAVNRFIGLTGTPTPNGIEDIWSQIYLMDQGERLGKNITAFRTAYMHPGYRNQQGVICSWNPNPGAEDLIYSSISDITVSMHNTELTLPPILFIDDYVYMSPSEFKTYKSFAVDAVLEFDNDSVATAVNAAVMSAKLQQLASGSIYTVDTDGNPTGKYEKIHEQKLERLQYIYDNSDDNLLIAYHFKSDADMISNYFKSKNIPCEIFDSNKADDYVKRWNEKQIPVLLIQPASAGFGLNFQYGGHTLIWYTLPFNLESYLQTIGRLYRQGQNNVVYIHRLMTDKTIDTHILKILLNKTKDMQRLLDAVEMSYSQQQSLIAFNQAVSLSSKTPITKDDMANAVNAARADFNDGTNTHK